MPLPVIANTFRVALRWSNTTDSRRAANVLHFERSGSETAANLQTALTAHATADMFAPCASTAFVDEVTITPLFDTSASRVFTPDPAVWKGGTSGDWMPQVAALVKETTDLRGKEHRGRIYLPWVGESAADSSGLSDAKRTTTTGGWVAFTDGLVGGGSFALGIASYKLRSIAQVTNIGCEKLTATVRRRNRG